MLFDSLKFTVILFICLWLLKLQVFVWVSNNLFIFWVDLLN